MSRARQIERIISKGQLVPLVFSQADVAASQTDVQLSIASVDNAADDQSAVVGYVMPFDGSIVAISLNTTAAATAGQMTAGPTIGGTEQTALTQTVTTATSARAATGRNNIPFVAGNEIGAEITTNSGWDATGADLVVIVWVLLHLEGI